MKIFKNSKPEVQLYWFLLKKSLSFHNFKLFVPRKGKLGPDPRWNYSLFVKYNVSCPNIKNSKIFMSISHLIPDQQEERKLLNDHGNNWSERHLNVNIKKQITNLKEINSYWTPNQ